MNTKSTKLAALLLSFGLIAAACGSGEDDATSAVGGALGDVVEAAEDTLTPDEDAMEDEAMEDEAMEDEAMEDEAMEDEETPSDVPGTVVDVALSSPEFSTLVAALTEADLVEALQGEGPFTVFAPTDEAFEELFDATGITAEQLLATSDLADTLSYHVIDGLLLAENAAIADGTSIVTLEGSGLAVDIVGTDVILNDDATVIVTDLVAGNGVVHVIDSVLLPQG